MSLAKRCQHEFTAATRNKGDSYWRRDMVTILVLDEDHVEASVEGSRSNRYTVMCDWSESGRDITATCTCPHYGDGSFCKHLWATLRAVDDRSPGIVSGTGRIDLAYEYDEEESFEYDHFDDDDDDYYDDYDPPSSTYANRNSPPLATASRSQPNRSAKGKSTPWHAELSRLPIAVEDSSPFGKGHQRTRSRPSRVRFVLDIGASFRAGALVINLFQQERRLDGEWGKIKPLKAMRNELRNFSVDDQRRLGLALGNYTGQPWGYDSRTPLHSQSYQQVSQVEVVPAVHDLILPDLCRDDSFGWVLGSDQPAGEARPLAWDGGDPWQFRFAIDDIAEKKSWRLRGALVRAEEAVPLTEPVLLLSSGVIVFQDRISRLAPCSDWRWIALLRARDSVSVPYADRSVLLRELWFGGAADQDSLPKSLRAEVEHLAPRGALTIHPPTSRSKLPSYIKETNLQADVHFDYAGQRVGLNDASLAVVDSEGDRVLIRDRASEEALTARLAELRIGASKPVYYRKSNGDVEFPSKRLGEIVEQLTSEGWLVQAEGRLVKRAGAFRATVTSGVDWFDLETEIDFDGAHVSLPQLLAALRNNERFIQLDDGSQGILPQAWLDRYGPLAEMAEIEEGRMRFRPSQALLIDALLAEHEEELQLTVDRQFRRLREKLGSFEGIKPRQSPPGFHGDLRPYQCEGLGWLHFLEEFGLGGCLADDMGLGKTVQVLAQLVAHRRRRKRGEAQRPSLVVAPKSVVFNWQLETERFAPRLSVINYSGLDRKSRAEEIAESDLVITTYGTLRRDIESLRKTHFDYVILDEAQAIKNANSVSAKACRLLTSNHRLVLTGTPVENHLGDLWSLFEFLNPGMLGRSSAVRALASSNGADDGGNDKSLEVIRRGIAPFLLRRTKEQVLDDLPEKNEQTLHVELLSPDRKRYNELRDHYRNSILKRVGTSGMNAARMHVLEALLRLRQAACHTGLVDKKLVDKPSAKLDALLDQLEETVGEGHKALVFSQFTSFLSIVKQRLVARGLNFEYLDGRTRDRQSRVERFQSDPLCPIFLISLKAGGTGLNLTAADYVFLLDPWWNPAVEAQAIDRAHRIGQQRPVFAYRLVARDTVEEKILELQQKKRDLADAIVGGDRSVFRNLSIDDLKLLLS